MTYVSTSGGRKSSFQLTRSRGAWPQEIWRIQMLNNFNSHAHVERDLQPKLLRRQPLHFNSHAHVERDIKQWQRQSISITISTHTLTWSVTILHFSYCRLSWFQLTRSRGAWRQHCLESHFFEYFNSHAHVERDHGFNICRCVITISTHTLTWSVTSRW